MELNKTLSRALGTMILGLILFTLLLTVFLEPIPAKVRRIEAFCVLGGQALHYAFDRVKDARTDNAGTHIVLVDGTKVDFSSSINCYVLELEGYTTVSTGE